MLRVHRGVPGNGSITVRFVVRGTGQVRVAYHANKGGGADGTVTLE